MKSSFLEKSPPILYGGDTMPLVHWKMISGVSDPSVFVSRWINTCQHNEFSKIGNFETE